MKNVLKLITPELFRYARGLATNAKGDPVTQDPRGLAQAAKLEPLVPHEN